MGEVWEAQPGDGVSSASELYRREAEERECVPALQVGGYIPDFTANSTQGEIEFYVVIDGHWTMFVTFPRNFDPVATTELAELAKMLGEFVERGFKVIAMSCNSRTSHEKWIKETEALLDCSVDFPLVADANAAISRDFGLVRHGESPAVRALVDASLVVIAGPDRLIRAHWQYPSSTGRNFHEILRTIDTIQLAHDNPSLACGVNWMQGEDVFIANKVSPADAKTTFPKGFVEIRPWFRLTPAPDPSAGPDQPGDASAT